MPGFNSKISYDPTNKLTLIIWTNLTVSLDGQQTANTLFVKMLDHVYKVSPLRSAQGSTLVRTIRQYNKERVHETGLIERREGTPSPNNFITGSIEQK